MENIQDVITKIKTGDAEGISLVYNAYIDFDLESIKDAISKYNKNNHTNYTINDIKDIGNKYGDLFLYLGEEETYIPVEGFASDSTDYKRANEIISY